MDGSPGASDPTAFATTNDVKSIALQSVEELAAGPHEVKVQFRVNTGGSSTGWFCPGNTTCADAEQTLTAIPFTQ